MSAPYFVGPDVKLGRDVRIHPFAVVDGHTTIGDGCEIYPHACVGLPPQDLSYKGTPTRTEIGPGCVLREGATVHRGSEKEEGVTRVGARCYLMVGAHVGHDCRVGDDVILTNYAVLGGHVSIGNRAMLSAHVAVHQFCRVGTMAMLGGGTIVVQDIPPYCLAHGDHARLLGLNEVGLKRRECPKETVEALRGTYRLLFRASLPRKDALEKARAEYGGVAEAAAMIDFVATSKRGVARHGTA